MLRAKRSIVAGVLLASLLLLQAPPIEAQQLVLYIDPVITGTLADDGAYISDVLITWPLDPDWLDEPDWTIVGGCESTYIYNPREDTPAEVNVEEWCGASYDDMLIYGYVSMTITLRAPTVDEAMASLVDGTNGHQESGELNEGQTSSLLSQLGLVQAKLDAGEFQPASNILRAFQNHLFDVLGYISSEWLLAETLR